MILCMTSAREEKTTSESAMLDECLKQIAEKDTDALSRLYLRTKDSVFGFALSILKNVHDAEDVLQECYLNVYSAASGYDSYGKPLAWILTITRNLCYRKLREHEKMSTIPQEDWERYLEEKEGITSEDKLVLHTCMNCLTEDERQIVVLHAVSGFKHREIAQLLSMRISTVLSKYNRALKKMRNNLERGVLQK